MIDPKTLSVEERAIVEETVTANVSFDGLACDLFWDKCYEFAIQRILARRALFGEPASEGAKVECPNCREVTDQVHRIFDGPYFGCQPAPPKVAMTEELERVLDVAKWEAHSIRSIADGDYPNSPESARSRAEADEIDAAIAAVRAQAAGVKLPPVEAIRRLLIFGSWPTGDDESYCAQKKAVIWLAELDAAEGKAETKEGK